MEDLRRESHSEFAPRYGAPLGLERSFIIDGRTWQVHETVDPVTRTNVLIFMTDGIARRVRHYPPDWRELSSDELRSLSMST